MGVTCSQAIAKDMIMKVKKVYLGCYDYRGYRLERITPDTWAICCIRLRDYGFEYETVDGCSSLAEGKRFVDRWHELGFAEGYEG